MTPPGRAFLESGIHGEIIAGPEFTSLMRFFDRELLRVAARLKAVEHSYPSVLMRRQLDKLGFFEAFPQHAIPIATNRILTPAICYHLYVLLERRTLSESPVVITSRGICFRAEGGKVDVQNGRLQSFSMREIIVIGSRREVDRSVKRIARICGRILEKVDVPVETLPAEDPFFAGKARGRKLVQKLANLKSEITYRTHQRRSLALGSVNHHRDFFGKRMKITLADRSPAHSGCVAFGLERLVIAFLDHHGCDAKRWPNNVARFVDRDAAR